MRQTIIIIILWVVTLTSSQAESFPCDRDRLNSESPEEIAELFYCALNSDDPNLLWDIHATEAKPTEMSRADFIGMYYDTIRASNAFLQFHLANSSAEKISVRQSDDFAIVQMELEFPDYSRFEADNEESIEFPIGREKQSVYAEKMPEIGFHKASGKVDFYLIGEPGHWRILRPKLESSLGF